MPNGECPKGAKNMADIDAIGREQKEQNRRLNLLESKLNWFMLTLIATLVVGIMNLLLDIRI